MDRVRIFRDMTHFWAFCFTAWRFFQPVDIREDEEQGIKLQETMELLVAAGYFRARIKGLHPFDKVI